MAKFENVAEFIIVRFKDSFSIFCGKVENSGSMEHFVKEFWLRESFESCRNMGKNLFVAEGYSLIDEEREREERRTEASGT